MPSINLLPSDLAPKASFVQASQVVKKLTMLGFSVLVISLGLSIGLFILFSNQLKISVARKTQLEQDIKALQQTEQKLILIKDRLAIAKQVLGQGSAGGQIAALKNLSESLPEGVSVKVAKMKKDSTDASFSGADSNALTQMFATLISSGLYGQIDLVSLAFIPTSGFSARFDLAK